MQQFAKNLLLVRFAVPCRSYSRSLWKFEFVCLFQVAFAMNLIKRSINCKVHLRNSIKYSISNDEFYPCYCTYSFFHNLFLIFTLTR